MPFDGNSWNDKKFFSYAEMLALINAKYPGGNDSFSAVACPAAWSQLCLRVLISVSSTTRPSK
jgi:hypothetical protein